MANAATVSLQVRSQHPCREPEEQKLHALKIFIAIIIDSFCKSVCKQLAALIMLNNKIIFPSYIGKKATISVLTNLLTELCGKPYKAKVIFEKN